MNILLLGPSRPELITFMISSGDTVTQWEGSLSADMEIVKGSDFLVSYGYRKIIRKPVLDLFINRAINLHISYLPYNRGADPNLWSFLDDTRKGVTIHYMLPEVDAGEILVQREVTMSPEDTLITSYERLTGSIESLFKEYWPAIRAGKQRSVPQPTGGSSHLLCERETIAHLLMNGWDTPVESLIGKGLSLLRS